MAKYQVFEFNDSFTRNRIQAMINPFLGSVQAGRGIQEYLVVCDNTNNTPDVISRNELVVDVYVKPTFVAEFIQLRFTNAGVNSFASIIGA
jgi:phage tail sheath protein FI